MVYVIMIRIKPTVRITPDGLESTNAKEIQISEESLSIGSVVVSKEPIASPL